MSGLTCLFNCFRYCEKNKKKSILKDNKTFIDIINIICYNKVSFVWLILFDRMVINCRCLLIGGVVMLFYWGFALREVGWKKLKLMNVTQTVLGFYSISSTQSIYLFFCFLLDPLFWMKETFACLSIGFCTCTDCLVNN